MCERGSGGPRRIQGRGERLRDGSERNSIASGNPYPIKLFLEEDEDDEEEKEEEEEEEEEKKYQSWKCCSKIRDSFK